MSVERTVHHDVSIHEPAPRRSRAWSLVFWGGLIAIAAACFGFGFRYAPTRAVADAQEQAKLAELALKEVGETISASVRESLKADADMQRRQMRDVLDLFQVANSGPVGMLIQEPDGRWSYATDGVERISGGKSLGELVAASSPLVQPIERGYSITEPDVEGPFQGVYRIDYTATVNGQPRRVRMLAPAAMQLDTQRPGIRPAPAFAEETTP